MLVVAGHGLPVRFHLDSATTAEVKLANWLNRRWTPSACLAREDAPGVDRTRSQRIAAMTGAHCAARSGAAASAGASHPSDVRRGGARSGADRSSRKADDRLRYTAERSFAWLGNFCRLLIRWERFLLAYRAFFAVALQLLLLCVRRLVAAGDSGPVTDRDSLGLQGGHVHPERVPHALLASA